VESNPGCQGQVLELDVEPAAVVACEGQDLLERGQRDGGRGEREAPVGAEEVGPQGSERGGVERMEPAARPGHAHQVGVVEDDGDAVGREAHVELAHDALPRPRVREGGQRLLGVQRDPVAERPCPVCMDLDHHDELRRARPPRCEQPVSPA
jgi:hypothetical protein